MSEVLNIALIQSQLVWENPAQNRADFSKKIDALDDAVDLVVLPEMFTSGFTMNPSHIAETMEGKSITWLKYLASKNQIAITGSLVIEENGNFYNRMVFVHPNGTLEHYDKRHTFTLAGEDKIYTSGSKKLIVDYKGWKICPLVCYDLRFPVWSRNVEHYDLLIYIANWPTLRMTAWDTLLKARAIENMSYCVGVNRVGTDHNNHDYSGHSAAYDVLGNKLDSIPVNEEAIEVVELRKKAIATYRNKLSFLSDQDQFLIK
ncbi:amidohydrolase [Gelidibacter salicanalis]|uniref:Omega-amidase YafV n=1 Tax=Gelidibacter salicanalis TaxID=291193 RepID=A0A934NIG2_9FLAO|nr:amidohydrolase [Gelidibacter salicanalis]MBJ7880049.1 amidohydrolase [Gelidibacter salicanalis]